MLEDPYDCFSGEQFNIGEIIVVGDGQGGQNGENQFPIARGPEDSELTGNLQNRFNEPADSGGFYDDWQDPDANEEFREKLGQQEAQTDLSKVSVKQIPYQLRTPLWKFVFYCRTFENGSDAEYRVKIKDLKKAIDAYYASTGTGEFKELFNAEHIAEIRKMYGRLFGPYKLNGTSLAVLHQPLIQPLLYVAHKPFEEEDYSSYKPNHYATLLTGDIELKSTEALELFQDYYQYYLDDVQLLQVMHHGSDYNWPFGVRNRKLHECPEFIINHGAGKAHHPGKEVIKFLHHHNPHHVYLNNELTTIAYAYYWANRLKYAYCKTAVINFKKPIFQVPAVI